MLYLGYLRNELLRRKRRTILTVTLEPEQSQDGEQGGGFGGGGFGGGGREVIQAKQSVITDLSKLGKPGEQFVLVSRRSR